MNRRHTLHESGDMNKNIHDTFIYNSFYLSRVAPSVNKLLSLSALHYKNNVYKISTELISTN